MVGATGFERTTFLRAGSSGENMRGVRQRIVQRLFSTSENRGLGLVTLATLLLQRTTARPAVREVIHTEPALPHVREPR